MNLPERTPNTMVDAIALSSPSGRMSKRARLAAQKRLSVALFGDYDPSLRQEETTEAKRERLLRSAQNLRDRGMSVKSFRKAADRIERQAAELHSPLLT